MWLPSVHDDLVSIERLFVMVATTRYSRSDVRDLLKISRRTVEPSNLRPDGR